MSHKVLLISSESTSSEEMASALSEFGFEMITALLDSVELETLRRVAPDVVVVRGSLSPLHADEICRQICRLCQLPVILVGNKPERQAYQASEAVATWGYYMCEPVSYGELAARIKVLLWRYGKSELPLQSQWDSR